MLCVLGCVHTWLGRDADEAARLVERGLTDDLIDHRGPAALEIEASGVTLGLRGSPRGGQSPDPAARGRIERYREPVWLRAHVNAARCAWQSTRDPERCGIVSEVGARNRARVKAAGLCLGRRGRAGRRTHGAGRLQASACRARDDGPRHGTRSRGCDVHGDPQRPGTSPSGRGQPARKRRRSPGVWSEMRAARESQPTVHALAWRCGEGAPRPRPARRRDGDGRASSRRRAPMGHAGGNRRPPNGSWGWSSSRPARSTGCGRRFPPSRRHRPGSTSRRPSSTWAQRCDVRGTAPRPADPLSRGLDLADQCGARPVSERARLELAAIGVRPRRARLTGVEALTASEHRVAQMAAEGMSNVEIAQTLFVTRKTVEKHLGNAYGKLGVTSRRSLAPYFGEGQEAGGQKPSPSPGGGSSVVKQQFEPSLM